MMKRDLTNSEVDRKSILGNNTAIKEIYKVFGLSSVMFEGKYRFTKTQVAKYYEVDLRTVERLLDINSTELSDSGYELFTGSRLKTLRAAFEQSAIHSFDATDIDVGSITQHIDNEIISSRTSSLGVFTFKALLNSGPVITAQD